MTKDHTTKEEVYKDYGAFSSGWQLKNKESQGKERRALFKLNCPPHTR